MHLSNCFLKMFPKNRNDEVKGMQMMQMMRLKVCMHCQVAIVLDIQCLLFHTIFQPFIFCSTN